MRPFQIVQPTAAGAPVPEKPTRLELEQAPRSRADREAMPYVLSDALAAAVNVALALDQPLLVTGEPGCGKTTLAWEVARQLGTVVHEFHTKSTSTARDLLYTFDAVRRFHDASVGESEARDASKYVTFQALGEAIRSEETVVVLIDEIDKAPRDFPNDLLNELDTKAFAVVETSPPRRYQQKVQHFILITSNSERRLPAPFLRRCAYAHVEFPGPEALERIVQVHLGDRVPSPSFVRLAVERFLALRALPGLQKPPSTGELLSWVAALARLGTRPEDLDASTLGDLPALQALIKMREDLSALERAGS